jgi:hypothetical protein
MKKNLMVSARLQRIYNITTSEIDVVQIVNDKCGADDMSDYDEWVSLSHWGMFSLERKSSNQRSMR